MRKEIPKHDLSYSSISTYERCPKNYHINYLEGKKKKQSVSMAFGSLVHEALEKINTSLMADKEGFGIVEAKTIYDKISAEYNLTFDYIKRGWEMVEKYSLYAFSRKANILRAEYPIETIIPIDGKDVKVLGYIDLIEVSEYLEIIDFKTGELIPQKEEVKANLQLNIYAYMVSKLFPELVGEGIKISFYHVPTGIKVPYFLSKAEIDGLVDIENYIIELYKRLSADTEWKETRNEYCFYCSGKKDCKEYKAQIEESYNPKVFEDFETLTAEFVKIKQKSASISKEEKELKELIKKHMDEYGLPSIETKSGIFNIIPRHKDAYEVGEQNYSELRITKLIKKEAK